MEEEDILTITDTPFNIYNPIFPAIQEYMELKGYMDDPEVTEAYSRLVDAVVAVWNQRLAAEEAG